MRYCYFCRINTDTVEEDCVVCGFSKPREVKEEPEETPEKEVSNSNVQE